MPVAGAPRGAAGGDNGTAIGTLQSEILRFPQGGWPITMLLAQLEAHDVGPAVGGLFQPRPAVLSFPTGNEAVGQQRGTALLGLVQVVEKAAVDTVGDRQKYAGGNGHIDAQDGREQLHAQPRRAPLAQAM